MQEPDISAQLHVMVDEWQRVRHEGYRFNSINRFGIGIDPERGPVRLAAELKKFPASEGFRLLEPFAQRAQALTEQWRDFLRDRETLSEFLRRRTGNVEPDSIDRAYLILRCLHACYSVGVLSDNEKTFGFQLPQQRIAPFIQRMPRQQNVSVRIVVIGVMDGSAGANPVCCKLFLDELLQQLELFLTAQLYGQSFLHFCIIGFLIDDD